MWYYIITIYIKSILCFFPQLASLGYMCALFSIWKLKHKNWSYENFFTSFHFLVSIISCYHWGLNISSNLQWAEYLLPPPKAIYLPPPLWAKSQCLPLKAGSLLSPFRIALLSCTALVHVNFCVWDQHTIRKSVSVTCQHSSKASQRLIRWLFEMKPLMYPWWAQWRVSSVLRLQDSLAACCHLDLGRDQSWNHFEQGIQCQWWNYLVFWYILCHVIRPIIQF